MKNRLARSVVLVALVVLLPTLAAQYRSALPGYHYSFPRDHFNHPDFQTEWWYYTGNLKSSEGHRFGFELTFFRQGVGRDPARAGTWDIRDLYLAHLALSDLDGGRFYHTERTNRAGPGIAGINEPDGRIWNGNWQIKWHGDDQELQAIDNHFELHFKLHSEKPPVIHGEDGVSQKADGAGHASHYISLSRLIAGGQIELGGRAFEVGGLAWMDHEFFTHQLSADQAGWDWMSVQLNDGTELMLFHIRRKDGSIDPHSSGTFVDRKGASTHLENGDFRLEPSGDTWTSPASHAIAVYPIRWKISIPRLSIELQATTSLPSQELSSPSSLVPSYWEGAVTFTGEKASAPVSGVGYLEMTGYDRPFEIAP
jgi:predicted secreted hydrolase